jgi:hypothetical protein
MSNFNELILKDIEKYLTANLFYSKKDLLTEIGKIYDLHKSNKKKVVSTEDKPKRELTKYQLFIKNKTKELKEIEDAKNEGDVKLKQKEIMTMAAKLWKEQKEL